MTDDLVTMEDALIVLAQACNDEREELKAENARLKAEVERLANPQVRELDIGVIEELVAERDRLKATLKEIEAVTEECLNEGRSRAAAVLAIRDILVARAVVAKHGGQS